MAFGRPAGRAVQAALMLLLLLSVSLQGWGAAPATAQVTTTTGGTSFTWAEGYSLVQHPVPVAHAEPWSITTDSHGTVWFVEQGANLLGEYDPASGNFTQYAIPTKGSTPDAVAVDSRGDVWFAELTANRLGELKAGTSNAVDYPIPGAVATLGASSQPISCGPGALLPDPSGEVWVACLFSNQIDEFNPATGTFSRFDLPVFQSAPAGMAFDGKGDLWFTAADSDMLGKAVLSQLRNGTDQGITEFAPMNQTYTYTFTHPTSFFNTTEVLHSSLPTPSGIALAPSGKFWVTEHVDSSFDSYDPSTGSLVRYWNSQTYDAYGYSVTFPNGIAVAPGGTVWIGEHYGNRIAEFVPSAGAMTEYPVPCCASAIAGVYSIALAPDGAVWFVEIGGDAIGEVAPSQSQSQLELALPQSAFSLGRDGAATIPLNFTNRSENGTSLSLSVSGISLTGALQNATANFGSPKLSVAAGGSVQTDLDLSLRGLDSGVYYLTLSATAPGGVIYSAVLKLTVTAGTSTPFFYLVPAVAGAAVGAGAGGLYFARRSRARPRRRRSPRISLTTRAARTANPRPAAP